ncbi:unnamed protein product [Cuscuta epithymum]|uniref:Uncharacterized protein n=1 Tax=Cuscuta epithymum TaxID=186058 RepID=A0AAV0CTY7_9ASTE|nr:unnamed protein product [Cuscuta epithymum]
MISRWPIPGDVLSPPSCQAAPLHMQFGALENCQSPTMLESRIESGSPSFTYRKPKLNPGLEIISIDHLACVGEVLGEVGLQRGWSKREAAASGWEFKLEETQVSIQGKKKIKREERGKKEGTKEKM